MWARGDHRAVEGKGGRAGGAGSCESVGPVPAEVGEGGQPPESTTLLLMCFYAAARTRRALILRHFLDEAWLLQPQWLECPSSWQRQVVFRLLQWIHFGHAPPSQTSESTPGWMPYDWVLGAHIPDAPGRALVHRRVDSESSRPRCRARARDRIALEYAIQSSAYTSE